MSKIPVGKTITDAYSFAFGGFLGNLGVVWLPLVVILAAVGFLLPMYFTALNQMLLSLHPDSPGTMPDFGGMMQVYRLGLVFFLLAILLGAQIFLGLTRRALGQMEGPVFVFFSVAKPYWRLVGAYLIMFVLYIVVIFVVEIAAVIVGIVGAIVVGVGGGAHSSGTLAFAGIGAVALGIACVFAVLYVMTRLVFLLTPAVVAEDRLAIMRSWELTAGNFWRIFGIILAIWLPLLIVTLILEFVLFAPIMSAALQTIPLGHPNDPQAAAAAVNGMGKALTDTLRSSWYILAAFLVLHTTLSYGLIAGAAASAYRSLTGGMDGAAPAA